MKDLEYKIYWLLKDINLLAIFLETVGDTTNKIENKKRNLKQAKAQVSEIYKKIKQIKVSDLS